MVDGQAFYQACMALEKEGRAGAGIGTLGEKTLHSVLKRAIEPDVTLHEVPIGRYVADVCNGQGIFEVQTRDLHKLRQKAEFFLKEYPVHVVHPILRTTELMYLDPETGALSQTRKSSKRGSFYKALPHIYGLKPLLFRPGFSLELVLLDGQEIRLLDGYGKDKKKRATHYERIPTAFVDSLLLEKKEDYRALLPQKALEAPFDGLALGKALGLRRGEENSAALVLRAAGLLEVVGKRGNAHLYAFTEEEK